MRVGAAAAALVSVPWAGERELTKRAATSSLETVLRGWGENAAPAAGAWSVGGLPMLEGRVLLLGVGWLPAAERACVCWERTWLWV